MRILLAIGLVILSAVSVFADERIWLENAAIDGKSVRMVFDSGSSMIGLTSQAVKRLGLKVITPPTNGFGETAACTLGLNGAQFRTNFAVINFYPVIPDFDGLVGWNALNANIFRIDAEAQRLTFLSSVPAGIRPWTQLLIDTNAGTLNLEIPGERKGQNLIFVDTGGTCGIALTTREWKRWKKAHPRNPITLRAYGTIDGIYVGEESWADQIQIGPLTLNDVPVMEEGPSTKIELGSERDVLGFAALRRLDLVVDGIHGIAYLRAKQTPPPSYSYNRLGAEFLPTATDSNDLVARVVTGSPGYEAGIRNGDILLKVDGQSISGWTNGWNESDTNALSMPAGTKLQLTLRRNRKVFETTAVLREILQPSRRKYNPIDDFPGKSELDTESYYNQGMECEIRGDLNGALTNYDKAIESNPNFGDAYGRRAYLEQSNSNLDAALADYSKSINLGSGAPEVYANCGMAEQTKGDLTAALADYNKALELEPDLAEVYAYRGSLEQRTNGLDPAIADYEKALQLKAPWPDIQSALAQLYAYRGSIEQWTNEFDAAIADYGKAMQLEPDLIGAKTNLAQTYQSRGYQEMLTNQLDAALADLSKAIELEPDLAEAYIDRGWSEEQTNEFDAAIADYEKALRLNPDSTDTKSRLAQGYGDRGDWEVQGFEYTNALTDFRRACELDPADDYAHFYIWLCNSSLGNSERATMDLKAYLTARGSKDSGDWPSEIGRFLAGQITEQDLLSAATSADTKKDKEQHCEAYYYIGSKRLFAGDKTGSVAEFRKCVATDVKNFNEYQFAKTDLQRLETNTVSP